MANGVVRGEATAAVDHSSGKIHSKIFWSLLVVNLVLLIAGVATTFPWAHMGVAGFAVTLVAIGIFTFLMLFVDSGDIRSALTASFVFVFLALMGGSLNETVSEKMSSGFAKAIFDNFSTLVSVIVGFYFGGKALEKAAESVAGIESRDRAVREVQITSVNELASGSTTTFLADAVDGRGFVVPGMIPKWASSDEAVANVVPPVEGTEVKIEAKKAGTAVITASADGVVRRVLLTVT